jgi:hypothetical protein
MSQCARQINQDLLSRTNGQSRIVHHRIQKISMALNIWSHMLKSFLIKRCTYSTWILSQDYLEHVHNVSEYRQIGLKIPEQVSKWEWDIRHFPYSDDLLVWTFLHLDPVSKFPETTKKPEYFLGSTDNVWDDLKI